MNTNENAIINARAWLESIVRMIAARDKGEQYEGQDAEEAIWLAPLSVKVRTSWHDVGVEEKPDEFCILLSTGGPALRIVGNLDEYSEPYGERLQWQDWGTPWTTYYISSGEERDALSSFVRSFYYGE
jgi:hypothetical protein